MNETVIKKESGEIADKYVFGFWLYLMTDLIMFAALFAVFAVLRGATFGGPAEHQLYDLKNALAETFILLTSSFMCGLAMLAAYRGKKGQAITAFAATFALGASFLGLELREFYAFAAAGNTPQASASLSATSTGCSCPMVPVTRRRRCTGSPPFASCSARCRSSASAWATSCSPLRWGVARTR